MSINSQTPLPSFSNNQPCRAPRPLVAVDQVGLCRNLGLEKNLAKKSIHLAHSLSRSLSLSLSVSLPPSFCWGILFGTWKMVHGWRRVASGSLEWRFALLLGQPSVFENLLRAQGFGGLGLRSQGKESVVRECEKTARPWGTSSSQDLPGFVLAFSCCSRSMFWRRPWLANKTWRHS